jgi:hypothetical protein
MTAIGPTVVYVVRLSDGHKARIAVFRTIRALWIILSSCGAYAVRITVASAKLYTYGIQWFPVIIRGEISFPLKSIIMAHIVMRVCCKR